MSARGKKVAEILISEAWDANADSRYPQALAAAERAERAAEGLRDPGLVVRALYQQEWALRVLGDMRAALVICTRILRIAQAPETRDKVTDAPAAYAICHAYQDFVLIAGELPRPEPEKLLGVLDEAERWLTATGRTGWRAGILLQRAEVHSILGNKQQALDFAQEALAAYTKAGPGYSLAYHHNCLGLQLSHVSRHDEAVTQFQAVLDTPGSSPYDSMQAHRYLADRAMASGQDDDAVRHADSAVRLGENCGNRATALALGTRAKMYRKLKRYSEALADFGRAVELSPEEVWVIRERAYLFHVLERYDEALADLDRLLQLDPGDAWAVAERDKVRRKTGGNGRSQGGATGQTA